MERISHLPLDERVKKNAKRTAPILRFFRKIFGWNVRKATDDEDKKYGIDAVVTTGNLRTTLQIKTREDYPDLLVEIVENISNLSDGRDLRSEASFYVLCDPSNHIWVYEMSLIKPYAFEAAEIVRKNLRNGKYGPWNNPKDSKVKWKALVSEDDYDHHLKVLQFFRTNAFPCLYHGVMPPQKSS